MQNPFVHGIESLVISEAEMHRGDDVVVSEYQKDASEEVNCWQQHGAEGVKGFARIALKKFDYCDGVDYQNEGDRPDEKVCEDSGVGE
ncbi:MAG TPA: hypothetical protein VK828_04740 [Terriglobales bacterium]|nr:hypothetical protein [Terriglobales bacterium]